MNGLAPLSPVPALPMQLPEADARQMQIALIYHAHLLAAVIETGADIHRLAALPRQRGGRMYFAEGFKARRYAIYLTATEYDRPGAWTARAAGVSKQAVSMILRAIEDARDEPETDALLARIAARAAGRPLPPPAPKLPSPAAGTAP